ncbi:hypothetical protein ALO75_200193 [Pseudomonas syringae pv. coryli]|uniref:Uncharacterized protein n=1 Tax=Pseudomonas syringae pv. coryli TaxID=317659 RepID=A0A0P9NNF8_9PSED|nr:hypothetical protein ALO75_200193 [Pseudomonas syringae pv. coryli]
MPMAIYSGSWLLNTSQLGLRPATTSGQNGLIRNNSTAKQLAMVAISPSTMASRRRKLAPCKASTISVSKAVSATPVVMETPSNR